MTESRGFRFDDILGSQKFRLDDITISTHLPVILSTLFVISRGEIPYSFRALLSVISLEGEILGSKTGIQTTGFLAQRKMTTFKKDGAPFLRSAPQLVLCPKIRSLAC